MNLVLNKALALFFAGLSFPFWPVFYFAIKITSRGPFIFKQKRMGKNRKVFTMYKIRTMHAGAEKLKVKYSDYNEVDGPAFKIKNDPRYTRIGKFLARTGLDEIPQLFNVINGDMALVGPRPLPVAEALKIPEKYGIRFSILPGCTSAWVIKGGHKLGFKKWMELDLDYVKNKSLWYDLRIIFSTMLLMSGIFMKALLRNERIS